MKKLLTIGVLLLGLSSLGFAKEVKPTVSVEQKRIEIVDTSFSKYPTRLYINAGVGYGFYDKVDNTREAKEIATEISIEGTKEFYPNVEIGLGIAFQKHGEPGDTIEDDVKIQLSEFKSFPLYLVGKYSFNTTKNGWKPFIKTDLGYSFNTMEDSKGYSEGIGILLDTKVTNGIYTGLTIGAEKENILFGLGYRFNKADIKFEDDREHYNSHRVMATIGYKFNI